MSGSSDPRVLRVQQFFETMSLDSLQQIDQVYAPDARFKDPFNDVRGIAACSRRSPHRSKCRASASHKRYARGTARF